jgi:pimeloyl-ACP methyl ester carboxylesterase
MGALQSKVDAAMFPGIHSSLTTKQDAVRAYAGVMLPVITQAGVVLAVAYFHPIQPSQPVHDPGAESTVGDNVQAVAKPSDAALSAAMTFMPPAELQRRPVVLYSHGNSEDLVNASALCRFYANHMRCTVVTYDYTGYGDGPMRRVRASATQACADILATYKAVRRTFPRRPVILMGFSIGTGPATWLASLKPQTACALVLLAPFTSPVRVPLGPKPSWPLALVGWCLDSVLDVFQNTKNIQAIACPAYIYHGHEDEVIPAAHSTLLHTAASAARVQASATFVHATHSDLLFHGRVLQEVAAIADVVQARYMARRGAHSRAHDTSARAARPTDPSTV